jgi:hypothetical protein
MRCRDATAALTILVLSCAAVPAGDRVADARVRVATRSEGRVVGTLLGADSFGLTLSLEGTTKTFALDDVAGFEVSRGRRSQKTKWALIGAIPWVVVATALLAEGGSDESGIVSPQSALLLGGGVAAGLVIGSHKKTDVWEQAPIPGATSRVRGRDLTVSMAVSF